MRRRSGGRVWIAIALIALLVVGLAWWLRGNLSGYFHHEEVFTEASPAAAEQAEAKLEKLRVGETVRLSSVELTSLLRYRAPEGALRLVREPTVALHGDTVVLSGRVPTDRLPSQPDLDRVRFLLPDTAALVVQGRVAQLPGGRPAFAVSRVTFSDIPIPARYYPDILRALGRRDEPGLAANALALPLPPQVRGARVEAGELVLEP